MPKTRERDSGLLRRDLRAGEVLLNLRYAVELVRLVALPAARAAAVDAASERPPWPPAAS